MHISQFEKVQKNFEQMRDGAINYAVPYRRTLSLNHFGNPVDHDQKTFDIFGPALAQENYHSEICHADY